MKRFTQKAQQGFTLIELMIVIAIIGILVAVALPAFQDYSKRARVSEGLSLAAGAKSAVSEYYAARNTWPTNNASAGLADPAQISGNAVTSVTVASNVITVAYNNLIDTTANKTLQLVATASNGSIQWTCSPGPSPNGIDVKYLPSTCERTPAATGTNP